MEPSKLIFPIWMMFVVPISWAAILPGTFLAALAGLLIALMIVRKGPAGERFRAAWEDTKKAVWRAWLNLCLAWLVGTALMLVPPLLAAGSASGAWKDMAEALLTNIYTNPLSAVWAIVCVLATVGISYSLHRLWAFRKTDLETPESARAALWVSVITAPWLFLSTMRLFY